MGRAKIVTLACLTSISLAATGLAWSNVHVADYLSGSAQLRQPEPVKAKLEQALSALPLYFIENRGQTNPDIGYYVQGSGTSVAFSSHGLRFLLSGNTDRAIDQGDSNGLALAKSQEAKRWGLELEFPGARVTSPIGQRLTPALVSYFQGHKDQWKTGLPTYSTVRYPDLWPGIDLVYSGSGGSLKYEFLVKPWADPSQIRLAWQGATSVSLINGGDLEVRTPVRVLIDQRPYSYQQAGDRRIEVRSAFDLAPSQQSGQEYGFSLGKYDRSKPLVIDPTLLAYAGYIGGSGGDLGFGIDVDSSGNAYVTGQTSSPEDVFVDGGLGNLSGPDSTYNGQWDAFVMKLNPQGTGMVYAGYIGGSDVEEPRGIAVDSSGAAYITGGVDSYESSFPDGDGFGGVVGPDVTFNGPSGGGTDAFVAKVNPAGNSLDYAGFIGGDRYDRGMGIAVDASGNAYVTGQTYSRESSFPDGDGTGALSGPDTTINGSRDFVPNAFIVKVNSAGTGLAYAGYIGGAEGTWGTAVAVDGSGSAYVTGGTRSTQTSFPDGDGFGSLGGPDRTHNGDVDGFLVKVTPAGTGLSYAGYVGGSEYDVGNAVTVDGSANAYLAGMTASNQATFPDGDGIGALVGPDTSYNGEGDGFVAKVNAEGTGFSYAGYIGGAGQEEAMGIAVDLAGAAYIAGSTGSNQVTFPDGDGFGTLESPDQIYNGGSDLNSAISDAFVAKINAGGARFDYAGYIGGSGLDQGYAVAADTSSNAYVTGLTTSAQTSFPDGDGFGTVPGHDQTYGGAGEFDAFVVKVGAPTTLIPAAGGAPRVTINQAVGQTDPAILPPVHFTAQFSKPVTGFADSDVDLSSSAARGTLRAAVSGGPSIYTVKVSGMTSAGTVVVTIPEGAAVDGTGKANLASTSTDNYVTWSPLIGLPSATG